MRSPVSLHESLGKFRAVAYYRDCGGEDGLMWVADFEFQDPAGNWHPMECWHEEKRGPVPSRILDWSEAFCRRAQALTGIPPRVFLGV